MVLPPNAELKVCGLFLAGVQAFTIKQLLRLIQLVTIFQQQQFFLHSVFFGQLHIRTAMNQPFIKSYAQK
jgi:hypothetical protein